VGTGFTNTYRASSTAYRNLWKLKLKVSSIVWSRRLSLEKFDIVRQNQEKNQSVPTKSIIIRGEYMRKHTNMGSWY